MEETLGFFGRQVVDASKAALHKTLYVERPFFVTIPYRIFDLNSNHNDGFIGPTASLSAMIDSTHQAFIDLNSP